MSEICGIVGDLKREEQGVYTFPCMTFLGYDSKEAPVQKLIKLGYKVGDEDTRYEGVEIHRSSPFQLMRTLGKEFNFRPLRVTSVKSVGGRICLMWTCATGEPVETIGIVSDVKREGEGEYKIPCSTLFGLSREEIQQLSGQGLKVGDDDPRNDGVEITGASPFKVMRILCSKYGWETDGRVVTGESPGDRTCTMWTLTRPIKK